MNTSSNILMHGSFARLVSPNPAIVVCEHDEVNTEKRQLEQVRKKAADEAESRFASKLVEEREKNKKLWATIETSFDVLMKQIETQIARQLIDLSVRIAEIIVRRELPDQTMVKGVIEEVLAPVSDLQGAKVRVCPGDRDLLLTARQDSGRQDLASRLEIVADTSLLPGDVVIESKNGYFDARIAERLKVLQEKLMDRSRYSDEYNNKS